MSAPPAARRPVPAAVVAVVLTLAVRTLVALSRLDELELELYGGSFAQALLHGMPLDPDKLPIIVHLRGSVLFGILQAPLFWLLGPTLVAVKVLAIAWSAATAACFAWVLERRGGRAAGLAGALLLALAPPFFQKVDVLALGSHGETLLPIWAALGWLIARRTGTPRTPRDLAVAGLLIGFGAWFSMNFLVALPALLAAWACAWWGEGGRPRDLVAGAGRSARGALAFAVGLAPMLALIPVVTKELEWVDRPIESQILPEGVGGALAKVREFLWQDLRRALLFDEHGGAWASWVVIGAALVGLALLVPRLARRTPSPLAVFVALHPLLFLAAYASTRFFVDFYNTRDGMGSRYLMPATPAVLAWVALGACWLVGRHRRALAYGLLGAAAAPCAVALATLVDPLPGLRQPAVFGARPFYFLDHLAHASEGDAVRYVEWSDRIDPNWPALDRLLYRAPLPVEFRPTEPFQLTQGVFALRKQPSASRGHQLAELGRLFTEQVEGDPTLFLESLEVLQEMHERGQVAELERDLVVHGAYQWLWLIGGGRAILQQGSSTFAFEALRATPEPLRRIAAAGLGFRAGVRYSPYDRAFAENLAHSGLVPEDLREDFFQSAGLGYRERFLQEGYLAPEPGVLRVEDDLPPEGLAPFHRGLRLPATAWRAAIDD